MERSQSASRGRGLGKPRKLLPPESLSLGLAESCLPRRPPRVYHLRFVKANDQIAAERIVVRSGNLSALSQALGTIGRPMGESICSRAGGWLNQQVFAARSPSLARQVHSTDCRRRSQEGSSRVKWHSQPLESAGGSCGLAAAAAVAPEAGF